MELTDEQRAQIEANLEQAKQRRLARYLEELEAAAEAPAEARQTISETLGGGFIPEDDGDQAEARRIIQESEMLYPLSLNAACSACPSIELDDFVLRNYGVRVCASCRERHPDRFALLTKTAAREEFLLTDEELRDGERMPHVSKPNPLKPTWSNMQLFLREQVQAFAIDKWGSLAAIEEEAQRRADTQQSSKEKRYAENLKELRRKTRLTRKDQAAPRTHNHRHTFAEQAGPAGETRSVCTACGFTVVSEEL